MVRADRRDVDGRDPFGHGLSGQPGQRLGVLAEGEQSHDREPRDAPHAVHRSLELVEVEERLEHEQVGAAAFEDGRLLGEELRLCGTA